MGQSFSGVNSNVRHRSSATGTGHRGFMGNACGDRLAYRRQGGDGLGKTHLQVIHNGGLLGVVSQVGFVQRINRDGVAAAG